MAFIERDGARIAYDVLGSEGPWLLLGHSLLCGRFMWDEVLPALTSRHRVINVEARGHGESTAPWAFQLEDLAGVRSKKAPVGSLAARGRARRCRGPRNSAAISRSPSPCARRPRRRAIRAVNGRPELEGLESLSVPTRVLVGEQDAATPPRRSEDIARRIPGASLGRIRGAGHLSAMERAERVAEELLAFLEEQT